MSPADLPFPAPVDDETAKLELECPAEVDPHEWADQESETPDPGKPLTAKPKRLREFDGIPVRSPRHQHMLIKAKIESLDGSRCRVPGCIETIKSKSATIRWQMCPKHQYHAKYYGHATLTSPFESPSEMMKLHAKMRVVLATNAAHPAVRQAHTLFRKWIRQSQEEPGQCPAPEALSRAYRDNELRPIAEVLAQIAAVWHLWRVAPLRFDHSEHFLDHCLARFGLMTLFSTKQKRKTTRLVGEKEGIELGRRIRAYMGPMLELSHQALLRAPSEGDRRRQALEADFILPSDPEDLRQLADGLPFDPPKVPLFDRAVIRTVVAEALWALQQRGKEDGNKSD